jgi:hypothetical protein
LSSSTPASSPATVTDVGSFPSGAVGNDNGNGSGVAGNGSGSGSGAASNGSDSGAEAAGGDIADASSGKGAGNGGQQGTSTAHAINIGGETGDDPVPDDEGDLPPSGKRQKKCTFDVWEHFTKKRLVIEDNRKTYVQLWA